MTVHGACSDPVPLGGAGRWWCVTVVVRCGVGVGAACWLAGGDDNVTPRSDLLRMGCGGCMAWWLAEQKHLNTQLTQQIAAATARTRHTTDTQTPTPTEHHTHNTPHNPPTARHKARRMSVRLCWVGGVGWCWFVCGGVSVCVHAKICKFVYTTHPFVVSESCLIEAQATLFLFGSRNSS